MGFGNYFTPPHRKSVKGLLEEQLILQAGNLEMDMSRQGARVNPMGGEGDGLGEVHISDLPPLSPAGEGAGVRVISRTTCAPAGYL